VARPQGEVSTDAMRCLPSTDYDPTSTNASHLPLEMTSKFQVFSLSLHHINF
jgi:hypothetical protein